MSKEKCIKAYENLASRDYATMTELRKSVGKYGIDFPITKAEEPGTVVVEKLLYGVFSYNGLNFHYGQWPSKPLEKQYQSFEEVIAENPGDSKNPGVRVTYPPDCMLRKPKYCLHKAGGTLCVVLGSQILAELGPLV